MLIRKWHTLALVFVLCAIVGAAACVTAPPELTPVGTQAFNNTRVIKGLDILRDVAIAANAETPPLMAEASTRKVVEYHQSSLKIIDATRTGWVSTVKVGLDELLTNLPESERNLLRPYVVLLSTILTEVGR